MRTPTAITATAISLLSPGCATLDYDPGITQPALFYVTKDTIRPPGYFGLDAIYSEIRGRFENHGREVRLFKPYGFGEMRLPQKGDVCAVEYRHLDLLSESFHSNYKRIPDRSVNYVDKIECAPGTA